MLENIKETPLSSKAWLSIPLILLGIYGGTASPFPLYLKMFCLALAGGFSLVLQYNAETLKTLLKPSRKGTWKWLILIVLITFVISFAALGLGDVLGFSSASNAALGEGDALSKFLNGIMVSISLIGEEIITAAIAFPLFTLFVKKMDDKKAWFVAAVLSALLFGLMHVYAYNWNLYQCLVAVGLTRLPFTWLWVKADSLRAGIIAHIIYDAVLFIPMIVAAL